MSNWEREEGVPEQWETFHMIKEIELDRPLEIEENNIADIWVVRGKNKYFKRRNSRFLLLHHSRPQHMTVQREY